MATTIVQLDIIMSSCGNPSTDHDGLMPRRLKFSKGKDCIKCKVNTGKIVIQHAVYCKACFTPLVTLKFRRALEPSINANAGTSKRPKLKASGSLLLGYSGGLGSCILLDMVQRTYFANESVNGDPRGGTNHPRGGNVWASCAVCYVEICSAFPETHDRTPDVMKALASYQKFDFIPLRLEDAFDDSWWRTVTTTGQDRSRLSIELGKDGLCTEALRCAPTRDVPSVDALRAYLESLPTQTAISNAIRIIVRLLLLYTARSRRASHLLLGTSLTALSVSLISCISQGGGHSIREELQEEWRTGIVTTNGHTDVIRVVRPLRDVTMKECAMFAWWNSIHVIGRDRRIRATLDIPGLTKDFIIGLEKDYPSTVSTIVRTCAKLEPKSASIGLCALCQRPIQQGLDDWKDRISIGSYSDAKLDADRDYLPTAVPPDSIDVSTKTDNYLSVLTHLCYSCRTTLTSRGSRVSKSTPRSGASSPLSAPFPVWASLSQERQFVMSGDGELWVREPQDEGNQRSRIANFLLDA